MRAIGAVPADISSTRVARSSAAAAILLIGAMALAAVPVMLAAVPPLGDYPGHLARIYVLHQLLASHDFAGMFQLAPAPVPNLAMDGIILGLMSTGMGVEAAGRVFLVLQLWIGALGIVALHAVNFRRLSPWPLLAFAFAYNEIFLWGFSNYLLGVGWLLLCFAAWRFLQERAPAAAMVVFVLSAISLYFCHFMALLFFVFLALLVEAGRGRRRASRRSARPRFLLFLSIVLAAAIAIPALVWHPPTSSTGTGGASAMAAPALFAHIDAGRIWWRLHLLFNFAASYNAVLDMAAVGALAGIVLLAWRSGRLAACREYAPALLGLLLVYFLVPTRLWGTDYVSERIPVFLFGVGLAAIDLRFVTGRTRALLAWGIAGLIAVRVGLVAHHWWAFDRDFAPLMKAVDAVAPGSRIYSLKAYEQSYTELLRQGWLNLPAYATIRRGAYYSTIFAASGQNVVVRTPLYAAAPVPPPHYRAGSGQPESDPFAPALLAFYDYVFIANPRLWPEPVPPNLQPLIATRDYGFYRISKD